MTMAFATYQTTTPLHTTTVHNDLHLQQLPLIFTSTLYCHFERLEATHYNEAVLQSTCSKVKWHGPAHKLTHFQRFKMNHVSCVHLLFAFSKT